MGLYEYFLDILYNEGIKALIKEDKRLYRLRQVSPQKFEEEMCLAGVDTELCAVSGVCTDVEQWKCTRESES